MRERNWSKYNRELVQRGSLTFIIDPKLFKKLKKKAAKTFGRPIKFSDALIEMLLMLKINFRTSYRALEGFAKSIFKAFKIPFQLPTYSLICKRAAKLKTSLPKLSNTKPKVILLDSSGMKVYGEGEWKVKIHGKSCPGKWLKIHVAMDAETQEIVAETVTESNVHDATVVEHLLSKIPDSVEKIAADGAYDHARNIIKRKGASQLIPPPRNARYKGDGSERDRAILDIHLLGNDDIARSIWAKYSGYNYRVLVETGFSRSKRLFGERFFSKTAERQRLENTLRCKILNKMRKL